jgi:hypothetical protein
MAPLRAFIVRPFGTKSGVDFDAVEEKLIGPVLTRLEIAGRTTGEIMRQGNIREDMFRLLVLSDIVIADISIHNANVFYELGVRHGLQERHTFLIRAKELSDKYPFDLETDRYFVYDAAAPENQRDKLFDAVRKTLASTGKDSPVFTLLPRLTPHSREALMVVPDEFKEEVTLAKQAGRPGDLRLLAEEATGFDWGAAGLRLVGNAQFGIRAYKGGRVTFEQLRSLDGADVASNLRLGTIYQKLAEQSANPEEKVDLLNRSEQAINRVLDLTSPPPGGQESADKKSERRGRRAEAFALLGSNAKSRWIAEWIAQPADVRQKLALRSAHLANSIDNYIQGFAENLDSFFPGINALALLKIQLELADALPEVWKDRYDDDAEAATARATVDQSVLAITGALRLALGLDASLPKNSGTIDPWREISVADLKFLTLNKPGKIGDAYRSALAAVDSFAVAAVRRNIMLFKELGLFGDRVEAALQEMAVAPEPGRLARVVLFTGHMVDAPDRPPNKARFPRTPEAERIAREMIEAALKKEAAHEGGVSLGIAGGACGSDMLFHDACKALDIPEALYLALPVDQFQVESVNRGGPDWVERYRRLCERVQPKVLREAKSLPSWLVEKDGYDIWQRNNLRMMFNALAADPRQLTLIALYNPDQDPDGPGGTAHLLDVARKWGFKVVELDARKLLA